MDKPWELSKDDQVVAQGHDDLAVRRVWSAWWAAYFEIKRLQSKLDAIEAIYKREDAD